MHKLSATSIFKHIQLNYAYFMYAVEGMISHLEGHQRHVDQEFFLLIRINFLFITRKLNENLILNKVV